MRAPVSVIIPTLNAASGLPACLGALGEGLEAGLIRELILTDGGSMDETAAIAEAAGAIWLAGSAGRGAQIARGVAASQGAWLLILHADTVLEAGWSRAVLDHIKSAPTKAGFGQLAFAARGAAPRFVAGWANLRARFFGLPYGDQALLVAADHRAEEATNTLARQSKMTKLDLDSTYSMPYHHQWHLTLVESSSLHHPSIPH